MKQQEESIISKIAKDIKSARVGVLAFVLYMLLMMLLFHEVCPMLIVTGLPCPGCGLTRAGVLLLLGYTKEAFDMHPFIYVWFAFFLYFLYNRYIKRKPMKYGMQIVGVIIVLMLLFYVYRMIVYFPNVEPMTWSKHRPMIPVQRYLQKWF